MNGKDGKPFKTRDGGVMRLEHLIADIEEEMYHKIMDNHEIDPQEARARRRKSSDFQRSSTAICQTRRPRTMCLI